MDVILNRYANSDYIFNLPIIDFIELYNKAIEKIVEDRMWHAYVVWRPGFEDHEMTFEDFMGTNKIQANSRVVQDDDEVFADQLFF